jgi:hypothetical protein
VVVEVVMEMVVLEVQVGGGSANTLELAEQEIVLQHHLLKEIQVESAPGSLVVEEVEVGLQQRR